MIKIQHRKLFWRAAFYATTIVLGLGVALDQLRLGEQNAFFALIMLLGCVFVIELYLSWQDGRRTAFDTGQLLHISQVDTLEEVILHVIMPLILYLSVAAFLFFNRQPDVRGLVMLMLWLLLTIMFINIRAHYTERLDTEIRTHYAYDLAKFLVFFSLSDALAQLLISGGNILPWAIAIALIALILAILTGLRYRKLEWQYFAWSIGGAIALALIIGILASFFILNPTAASTYSTLLFYIYIAVVYHLMHRDLSWELVLEYTVVLTLTLVVLRNIT